jgi:hypothetical protein
LMGFADRLSEMPLQEIDLLQKGLAKAAPAMIYAPASTLASPVKNDAFARFFDLLVSPGIMKGHHHHQNKSGHVHPHHQATPSHMWSHPTTTSHLRPHPVTSSLIRPHPTTTSQIQSHHAGQLQPNGAISSHFRSQQAPPSQSYQ